MTGELKSTLDLVMDKLKGVGKELPELTQAQKERIAEIRRKYEAKIAEAKILTTDKEKLGFEILKFEEKREEEIEKVYKESQ
jgi:predicted  nucleic acid-binding Zn-ribbon protein